MIGLFQASGHWEVYSEDGKLRSVNLFLQRKSGDYNMSAIDKKFDIEAQFRTIEEIQALLERLQQAIVEIVPLKVLLGEIERMRKKNGKGLGEQIPWIDGVPLLTSRAIEDYFGGRPMLQ
jgi:hypothetical protein